MKIMSYLLKPQCKQEARCGFDSVQTPSFKERPLNTGPALQERHRSSHWGERSGVFLGIHIDRLIKVSGLLLLLLLLFSGSACLCYLPSILEV